MRLLRYEAHNVLGVKDIQFDLDGHHLFLVGGKNAQGKSSALTALLMALCGKRGMDSYPEIQLRDGEDKGWVKVDLSGDEELHDVKGFSVELFLRRKRTGNVMEEFRVLDSTGEEAAEPRTLLQSLFALKAFDPLAFARMKPKDQANLVQDLLGVDLKSFDEKRAKVFEVRRQIGVEGKKLAGKFDLAKRHADAPEKEESLGDLLAELDRRQKRNETREKLMTSNETYVSEILRLSNDVTSCHTEIERLKNLIEQQLKEIKWCEEECKSYLDLKAKGEEALESMPEEDESEIREKMKNLEGINAKVRANKEYDQLKAELDQSRKDYESKTRDIEKIDREKVDAIESAPWPVEGMELKEDGVLLNGRPLESASTAERTMASIKVGMALNPKLRLLVCQNGSELDSETLDTLEAVLKENDFQMIVELVTRTKEDEDRCAVVIANGELSKKE